MPLYLNELAPWERKREYYNNLQLGRDVRTQTTSLLNAITLQTKTQLASASTIISSNERIAEAMANKVDDLKYTMNDMNDGLQGIKSAFEWGIADVIWQIEQNRQVLTTILDVLSAPLNTQAKELKKRAQEAYANGWIDDAVQDFEQSERINRYDFSIHISMGMIYLFHKVDKRKALEYFDKAIKYAGPKSNYHTSFALLHKALIKHDMGLIEEAELCSSKAAELSPSFAAALYQCAQYNALLGKKDRALQFLRKAILHDINYCDRVCNDDAFRPLRAQVDKLFTELREAAAKDVKLKWDKASNQVKKVQQLLEKISISVPLPQTGFFDHLDRIHQLVDRNSYRDYLEASRLIEYALPITISELKTNLRRKVDGLKDEHQQSVKQISSEGAAKAGAMDDKLEFIYVFGMIISVLLGMRGCYMEGPWSPNPHARDLMLINPLRCLWPLLWIPVVGTLVSAFLWKILAFLHRMNIMGQTTRSLKKVSYTTEEIKDYIADLDKI